MSGQSGENGSDTQTRRKPLMSQTNSTVSISNHQSATSVSPLDRSGSSKNDIYKADLVSEIRAFMKKFQDKKAAERMALKQKNLDRIHAFRKENGMIKKTTNSQPLNYVCTSSDCYN